MKIFKNLMSMVASATIVASLVAQPVTALDVESAVSYGKKHLYNYNKANITNMSGGDCTSFVSQCLSAGGLSYKVGNIWKAMNGILSVDDELGWYYNDDCTYGIYWDDVWTYTWSGADAFGKFFLTTLDENYGVDCRHVTYKFANGGYTDEKKEKIINYAAPGDVIQLKNSSEWGHSVFVISKNTIKTKTERVTTVAYVQHTSDKRDTLKKIEKLNSKGNVISTSYEFPGAWGCYDYARVMKTSTIDF